MNFAPDPSVGLASDAILADAELAPLLLTVRNVGGVLTPVLADSATDAQRAAAQAICDGVPLVQARASRMADLDAWFRVVTDAGVTVSGITLDASVASQNRIDALVTMILAAIAVGAADASTPVTAYAIDGSAVTLPAGQLMGLLLQYGQACATLSASYAACRVGIAAATTAAEALAVPLPG